MLGLGGGQNRSEAKMARLFTSESSGNARVTVARAFCPVLDVRFGITIAVPSGIMPRRAKSSISKATSGSRFLNP